MNRLVEFLRLIKRTTPGLYFVNFLFGKVFGLNLRAPVNLHFTSKVIIPQKLSFAPDLITRTSFAVSGHCYFQAVNGIKLGANCLFAPGVKLISANHASTDDRKAVSGPGIVVGENVWIGANAVILPGVTIGNNVIIGAGSVVSKSFPEDNLTIAGVPARIISRRSGQSHRGDTI